MFKTKNRFFGRYTLLYTLYYVILAPFLVGYLALAIYVAKHMDTFFLHNSIFFLYLPLLGAMFVHIFFCTIFISNHIKHKIGKIWLSVLHILVLALALAISIALPILFRFYNFPTDSFMFKIRGILIYVLVAIPLFPFVITNLLTSDYKKCGLEKVQLHKKMAVSITNYDLEKELLDASSDEETDKVCQKIIEAKQKYPAYVSSRCAEEIKEIEKSNDKVEYDGKSKFDGKFSGWILYTLLKYALAFFTLGICYSIGIYLFSKWKVNHTVINGRRLSFKGKISQIFWKCILWEFLGIVTFGLFSTSVPFRIKKWEINNSDIVGGMNTESKFNSQPLRYFGTIFLALLIKVVTFGLLEPYGTSYKNTHIVRHTVYNGYHLEFLGSANELFAKYILWYLLGMATAGIYLIVVVPFRIEKWVVENTRLEALVK